MEVQANDSKKIFKVFDASKRKRARKKREGEFNEFNSIATDESNSVARTSSRRIVASAKASLQNVPATAQGDGPSGQRTPKRECDTSPSASNSPTMRLHHSRSPRRHRRKEGLSLALKAGMVSTPRSGTPHREGDGTDAMPHDQDSFLYDFLEEAIKKDKKRQQRAHRRYVLHSYCERERDHDCEQARDGAERGRHRESSPHNEHRHRHRRRRDGTLERCRQSTPYPRRSRKESVSPDAVVDQAILLQTFAKICSQLKEKPQSPQMCQVSRVQSHKSLQCDVAARRAPSCDADQRPTRLRSPAPAPEYPAPNRADSRGYVPTPDDSRELCYPPYEYRNPRYSSKLDVAGSRAGVQRHPYPEAVPTRSCVNNYAQRPPERRPYEGRRDLPGPRGRYEDDKRKYLAQQQQTSRSFDVQWLGYPDEERLRRTARSDLARPRYHEPRDFKEKRLDGPRERPFEDPRDKHYEVRERRYDDDRLPPGRYDDRRDKNDDREPREPRERHTSNLPSRDRRSRRNLERLERNSVASREDDYRERDKYSERERDSGLSVADGENSTVSGKSNYLKLVKQEIAEQREAMDKMMKLWQELMRCFKGLSRDGAAGQGKAVQESAANVQESAAAQLRLWRECMRRYETVARDVGDTDARLMEEIGKQRSEMAEMAGMWQECLQRYRDISTDFNNLKQKLATSESPTRAPAPPLVCAEGECSVPPQPYRVPPYPPYVGEPRQMPPHMAGYVGSPLRSRASMPPAWWWCGEPRPPPASPPSPRRRSSPDSRGSRDHRHRHRDHDESKYKEKSKPNGARSEHRHRKR